MDRIRFAVSGRTMRGSDAAIVLANEDPREALVEAVAQNIAIDIDVTCGGITLHLAAWQDPDHWEEDWREKGVEDVDAFVAGLVTSEER